ncbi:MAG TPA: GNAT family N-acetyltransferase [Rubrobacter sp.]|nr:GNAT family N-acetyltransferase [Rubrobacter sp.]
MAELPEEYKTTVPSGENAEEVVALIVACQLADTGEEDMSLDELIDDWHELDLATEAVVVVAPDGRIAGYADVISRSYVTVSVYGYVHPDHRERGIGASLVAWGERWTRDHIPQAPDNARVIVQHYVNAANEGAQTPRIRRLRAGARGVRHGDRTR